MSEALAAGVRLEAKPCRRCRHVGDHVIFGDAMMGDGRDQIGRRQIAVGIELATAEIELLLDAMRRRHHDAREQHGA